MNVGTNASAKHNSFNQSGQRAEPPKYTHKRSRPFPWAVTLWSNLPAWKMQKIKLDQRRRNNNLNVQCGSDGRKKPTGYHPSPDGASERSYAKSSRCTICPAGELSTQNNVLLLSLAHVNVFHKDYPPSRCRDGSGLNRASYHWNNNFRALWPVLNEAAVSPLCFQPRL